MQAVFLKVVTQKECIRKKRYLIGVQRSTDKKLAATQDRQRAQNPMKSNIVSSTGSYVWLFLLDFAQTEIAC